MVGEVQKVVHDCICQQTAQFYKKDLTPIVRAAVSHEICVSRCRISNIITLSFALKYPYNKKMYSYIYHFYICVMNIPV